MAFGQTRSLNISQRQNLETAGQSLYIIIVSGWYQRRYDNITTWTMEFQSTAAKSIVGVVCMITPRPPQHLCCTLIDISQSTHVMLSYLLWDGTNFFPLESPHSVYNIEVQRKLSGRTIPLIMTHLNTPESEEGLPHLIPGCPGGSCPMNTFCEGVDSYYI